MRVPTPCGVVHLVLSLLTFAFAIGSLGLQSVPAQAQSVPKSLEEGGSDAAMRLRKNNWTVGVAGGQLSGTYMTFANELAEVLDDGDNLRVIPIVTYGAASNLDDLLYLRQVDVAVTQADVFDYFRTQRKISNLEHRVNYLIRLPVSEIHVLARTDIQTIEDLRGKKVSFGPAGSASSLTGTIVFQAWASRSSRCSTIIPPRCRSSRAASLPPWCGGSDGRSISLPRSPRTRACISCRSRFPRRSPTITRSANSRTKIIRVAKISRRRRPEDCSLEYGHGR